ncbi:MAG: HEAT repeat domain-containing protein, partial [Anaerolineales bacterium]|nr:HEAT repeat domain-containing protein [Anaerolineales bacterium]
SLASLFDPALRFQQAYAEYLRTRFRYLPCPSPRTALASEWVEPRGLVAALARGARVVITGAPGSGKTTTLMYLAVAAARALLENSQSQVPLFFSARDESSLPHIYDLPRGLNLSDALSAQTPRIFFASAFATRRALVLLDDADALAPDARHAALKEYQNATIIASAETALPDFAEYRLPGFRDGDIETFAKHLDAQTAAAFLSALKANNVPRFLTANPMTLNLLARVWRSDTPLPTRRTDLFDAYTRELLGDAGETIKMLEAIALAMQRDRAASNESPRGVARSRGFLRAAKNRTVEFAHESWQAYFAARALRETAEFALLRQHLADPMWCETLLFYAGLGDATELVLNLQSQGDALLAARAVAHARDLRADLRAAVMRDLKERAWSGDPRALAILGELNNSALVDDWAAKLKDADPNVRLRAAEMLGRLQTDRGVDYLLPHLRDANADVRDTVVEALGHARTDRVIEPLLVALRGDARVGVPDVRLRVAAANALGEIASDKALPALVVDLQTGEPEVRAAAANALKRIHSPLLIEPLRGLAQSADDELRRYAEEILLVVNGRN